ncbi:MAG: hypothetical protein ACO1O1_04780 [Adhaeribacter sp.]
MHYVTAQLNQVGSRLNRYLLFKKISIDTLAREASISSTLISNMLNGGSYDFIFFLKVIHRLPDLNTHWLCTGQGEMLVPGSGLLPAATQPVPALAPVPEALLPPANQEVSLLRRELEEKNILIRRLKQTLAPVQHLLLDVE